MSNSLSSCSKSVLGRHGAILLVLLFHADPALSQSAPALPDRPWHSAEERQTEDDAKRFSSVPFSVDPAKTYSLAELIDLAEAHNPETSLAWERARAQAAALGIARSELYPTLAAVALSGTDSFEILVANSFYRETIQTLQATFDLSYTIFDFGARAGRISQARAEVLAANFDFNDVHRNVIYQVEEAYYGLLNATGQEAAVRASLSNAQTVQQAAEDRLKQGLATLPDVLEARSATAQADYELQAVLGAEEIARGNLSTALGTAPTVPIHVQPLTEITIPESADDTVEQGIGRALEQRPDLLQQVAEIRSARGRVKEANAAFYPSLTINVAPNEQLLYGSQQFFPWLRTASAFGELTVNLSWTLFDGGARRNRLRQAQAGVRAAEAQANVTRDQLANEVWAAYSDLNTAFRQRQAATALLDAASQSYAAALESYKYGVRSLLDVTAAQQTLAQARSTDVSARTQVLGALAELAFRTGDSIRAGTKRP
jgi:outer membrane protein